MEWLNDPSNNVDTNALCVIRICNDKNYCEGYGCIFLFCKANN